MIEYYYSQAQSQSALDSQVLTSYKIECAWCHTQVVEPFSAIFNRGWFVTKLFVNGWRYAIAYKYDIKGPLCKECTAKKELDPDFEVY